MFAEWEDFSAAVPSRLTLPLDEFSYNFEYVPLALEPIQRRHAQKVVTEAIVDALRTEPECSLTALRLATNSDESNLDRGDSYFAISYASPVFNFVIQMGATGLQMRKTRSTLQNLLLTSRLFARIARALFPVSADGQPDTSPFEEAGVLINGVRLSFAWSHHLVLGAHLGNEREANNVELIEQLLRVGDPSNRGARQPLARVDPGAIRRGDINLGYTKELAGRPRQLWISVEGPWNVTQKDIDILVIYRLGESDSPLKSIDLCDFRTPFLVFYRDEIVKGFFSDLFADIDIAGRQ